MMLVGMLRQQEEAAGGVVYIRLCVRVCVFIHTKVPYLSPPRFPFLMRVYVYRFIYTSKNPSPSPTAATDPARDPTADVE